MSDARKQESGDEVANAVADGLRFRYRAFLVVVVALAACVLVSLVGHGTAWSRAAMSFTGLLVGLGVPWLGWHLRVRFITRVAAPILQLAGLALHGQDPRDNLWSLADLPVLFFLLGWGIDICLRQQSKGWSIAGRSFFTLVWVYLAKETYLSSDAAVGVWFDVGGIVLGIVAVWMPQGSLLPSRFRLSPEAQLVVDRGMKKAGGWIAGRAGIAILIILPSLIFLDVLELPPLLRAQFEKAAAPSAATSAPGAQKEKRILFWLREGRALTEADLPRLEIHTTAKDATRKVINAIRLLRRYPRDQKAVEALRGLSDSRLKSISDLELYRGVVPVFYLELSPAGDDRATSGMFSVPESKWAGWDELRVLTESDLGQQETRVRRATLIILASGILILMLLGGSNGGVTAAWWLAIFFAGINMGWASESLELTVERVRFVMWRDYADHHAGATMFGIHSLLLFLGQSAEWLTNNLVAHAGIWVALCWPVRPGRLVRSHLDHFWVQGAKVVVLAVVLYALRLIVFMYAADSQWGISAWYFLFPLLLVGSGAWWRRRNCRSVRLPVVGKMAALAFILRGWVPFFTVYEAHWAAPGGYGLWVGHAGVTLTLIATVLLLLALERGTFLSPPHVEGQIWLIGVAALPFIESVIGDPVSELIADSDLFLGTTGGWLAFAVAVWLIGPISEFVGKRLSRWRARGLLQIEEAREELKSVTCAAAPEKSEPPLHLCFQLFAELGICQPQLWRHLGDGNLLRLKTHADDSAPEKIISARLAEQLGEEEGALRLEEMRMEWRWAAFQIELEHWFITHGDLLLIPATHEGQLIGILSASDVPGNRFMLRPAVAGEMGRLLATALLLTARSQKQSFYIPAEAATPLT